MHSRLAHFGLVLALLPLPLFGQRVSQQRLGSTAMELVNPTGPLTTRGPKLMVQVYDLEGKPIPNVQVTAAGPNSVSPLSDVSGRAVIELAPGTARGSRIRL